MAGDLKQAFLEAVRTTPDGISGFLTAVIPTPPDIPYPETVNGAIIVNGICAKYIMDLFAPFAGLTPIELLLRIGQHNSVLESAMLAGLEYITGASDEGSLSVLHPAGQGPYSPGKILFRATGSNATLRSCSCKVDPGGTIVLSNSGGGTFDGYLDLTVGWYRAWFAGTFEDNTTDSATVSFSISDTTEPPGPEPPEPEPPEPEPPEPDPPIPPDDDPALKDAKDNVLSAYKNLIKAATERHFLNTTLYSNAFKHAIDTFLQVCSDDSLDDTINADKTRLTLAVLAAAAMPSQYTEVKTISSELMNFINTLYTRSV